MRTIAALLIAGIAVFAQSPEAKNCSADGFVVNSVTGAPIARASVSVNKTAAVLTDVMGRWSLESLPCGDVVLSASRQNFLTDRRQQVVSLVPSSPLHDVKIQLEPQAVMTGHVLDDQGDPLEHAQIFAMPSSVIDGVRRFEARSMAMTNDIGEYRVAGLSAGKYRFCANPGRAVARAYVEQCADVMSIAAGSSGTTDFQFVAVSPRHVRGTISGLPDGVGPQIVLESRHGTLAGVMRADRTFDIEDVSPGPWTLIATAFGESERLIATQLVEVDDADVEGVRLALENSLSLKGTVRLAPGMQRKPDDPQYTVVLTSSQLLPRPDPASWNEDRTAFTFAGVVPGSYRLEFTPPPPFFVKSATLGARDIAGAEVVIGPGAPDIDVVLSDEGGAIEGGVSTDDGAAAAWVLVQQGRLQHLFGHSGTNGHFRMEGLPPGDYVVSAWDEMTNVEYADPAWMQLHAKSVAVTVEAAQTGQIKLTRQVAPND